MIKKGKHQNQSWVMMNTQQILFLCANYFYVYVFIGFNLMPLIFYGINLAVYSHGGCKQPPCSWLQVDCPSIAG
jgi:hypothetical protein